MINNKIGQNRAQYDLNWQIVKISALSSGNVSKHEFLNGKNVLPVNNSLEKAATIKWFGYFSLGNELKWQPDIAKKKTTKNKNSVNN